MKTTVLTLFFICIVSLSYGQGTITGTTTDGQFSLPGASVVLKGTTKGVITDFDGAFTLSNVPEGTNTLVFSYIGFEPKEIEITLKQDETKNLGEIVLSEGNQLDEVLVRSVYKPSQQKALSIKKESINISEVLAADAIGKLPDRNAAEAVQRLSGVSIERDAGEGRFVAVRGTPIQWTSSTLNGNRMPSASGDFANRGLQMDIFPSELIEFVKLSKVLTPNIDGDAIGGSIDFITKSAPFRETLSVNFAGGYVEQSQSPTYNASIVYGNRITDKLRFIGSAVIWNRSTGIDEYRNIYDFNNPDPTQSFAINQFEIRDYIMDRRTLGFNFGLDYEINEKNSLFFKGLYSQYLDQQDVRENYFNFQGNNTLIQTRFTDYVTNLYSLQVGGESLLSDKLFLDYGVNFAKSSFKFDSPDTLDENERGLPIVNFVQPTEFGNRSSDGLRYMNFDSPDGVGEQVSNVQPNNIPDLDPSTLLLNQLLLFRNSNEERDLRGQFNFKYEANDRLTLSSGFRGLNKQKEFDSNISVWLPGSSIGIQGAPITTLNDLTTENFPTNGGFLTEINEPYNDILVNQITEGQLGSMFTSNFIEGRGIVQVQGPEAASNQPRNYSGKENVYATYFMADLQVNDKLSLNMGIRNEYNDIEFNGKRVVTTEGGTEVEDVVSKNTYNMFLPMVQARYEHTPNTIFRAGLTRSFARPDFDDLNPGTVFDDIFRTITTGNTELEPTTAINADLMFEHYFGDVGIISAGGFYKHLNNLIFDNQSIVNIDDVSFLQSRPENVEDSAWLLGFEVGISKRFTELDGFFSKFGVEGNYSFVDSKVRIPNFENGVQISETETTLPQQAKHIFNAILFYESDKFMARIAGNFKGKYLSVIRSSAGPEHYQFFDDNFTVDFTSSYSISKKLRVFLELNNITNEPNVLFHGNRKDRVERESYFGLRGQVGLSFNL